MNRSPDTSPKGRNIKRKLSELSVLSTKVQLPSYHPQNAKHSISILMLQSFLNDTCKSISTNSIVNEHMYNQVPAMRNLLNDCLALSNISLEFYRQVEAALNLTCKIYEYSCFSLVSELVNLLGIVLEMIDKYRYCAESVSLHLRDTSGKNIEGCLVQLKIRINRVTPRVINIWRNIISPIREIEKVCYGFLRFYSELDPSIPRLGYADPVTTMYRYCRNPGHVVQIIRKTHTFLDNELVSVRICCELNDLLIKTPPELLACIDKTMTGFLIWDLIRYALEYYRTYAIYHYKLDIFDHNLQFDEKETNYKDPPLSPDVSDRSFYKPRTPYRRNKTISCVKRKRDDFSSPEKSVQEVRPRKELSFDHLLDYEIYVSERFREFLMEKIKNCGDGIEELMQGKKSEILEEFNQYIELLDHQKIANLWREDNLAAETSRLASYDN